MINIQSIVNKPVVIREVSGSYIGENPARVCRSKNRNFYTIELNADLIKQWAVEEEDIELIKTALIIHELGHIKFSSFSSDLKREICLQNRELYHFINNLIEDARVEYLLSLEFPLATKYFSILKILINKTMKVEDTKLDQETQDYVNNILKLIFCSTKLNFIPSDFKNDEAISFIISRLIVSRRCVRNQAALATIDIYRYIEKRIPQVPGIGYALNKALKPESIGNAYPELEEEMKGGIKLSKSQSLKLEEVLGDLKQAIKKSEIESKEGIKSSGGELGGSGTGARGLTITETEAFYQTTIKKHATAIDSVRRIFTRIKDKLQLTPAFEGDLSLNKIQDAFIASFTGDPGKYFVKYSKMLPKFDCLILRDVSGSTQPFMDGYAENTVIIAEALSRIKTIRLAIVDFESEHYLIKGFNEPMEKGRIFPRNLGGTALGEAMTEISKDKINLNWSNYLRFVIIFTDGRPDSFDLIKEALELNYYQHVIFMVISIDYQPDPRIKELFKNVIVIKDVNGMQAGLIKLLGGSYAKMST